MLAERDRNGAEAMRWTALAAVAVYVVGDLLAGALYPGYSFKDQAISELTAFGSPVRRLMVAVMVAHCALLLTFGVSIFRVAHRRTACWLGVSLVATSLAGIPTHTLWAMTVRGLPTAFNDTMHVFMTMLFGMLTVSAILLSALTYPGRFRIFALAMLSLMVMFGIAAAIASQGLEQNHTPWLGTLERLNAYAYFSWLVGLSFVFLRRRGEGRLGASSERPLIHDALY